MCSGSLVEADGGQDGVREDGDVQAAPAGRVVRGRAVDDRRQVARRQQVQAARLQADGAEGGPCAPAVGKTRHQRFEVAVVGDAAVIEAPVTQVAQLDAQRLRQLEQAVRRQHDEAGVCGGDERGEDEVLRLVAGPGRGGGATLVAIVEAGLVAVVAVGDDEMLRRRSRRRRPRPAAAIDGTQRVALAGQDGVEDGRAEGCRRAMSGTPSGS